METQTKQSQEKLSPQAARQRLAEGNGRFMQSKSSPRDLKQQVLKTSAGQYPFAVVLSCIDSRVPAELVFDQGIGDIFSARVAGNIINEDILASIEYACKVAGSKLVVVLGHSKCGAVTAACESVQLGNITALLDKIKPAVELVKKGLSQEEAGLVEKVIAENIKQSIKTIREQSSILAEMEENQEIEIVGALYSVDNGEVVFL